LAQTTKRRAGELVRGIFQILLPNPEGLPVREIRERLEKLVPPSDYESGSYPGAPTKRRYFRIARFSTIGPVKAGWLIKNKGTWLLTDEGRAAFEKFDDPEAFIRETDRLYRVWKAGQPADAEDPAADEASEVVSILEEAEEAAWSEIETFLESMNPYDFQDVVAGLLRGMGYFVEWVSPPGPDKGIDIVAHADPLGVKGPRIKVQVKRRADRVSADGIRGFMALIGDTDVGLFVCTGGFTRDAEEEARRQERRRIMLLDLERLFDLWTEHYDHIPEVQRRLLPLRPVYYLAPDE